MADIIIYTTPEKLLHKQDKLEDDEDKSDEGKYVWDFHRRNLTEKVKKGDKIYFATKGFIRGYFIAKIVTWFGSHTEILFESKTWKDITPIPETPFQGYKYFKGEVK